MATFIVTYRRRGQTDGRQPIEATSESEARNRFLGLDWVAFCEVEVLGIEPAGLEPIRDHDPYRPRHFQPYDWRAEARLLSDEINRLSEEARSLARQGKHDEAAEVLAMAKARAQVRADITKRNKGK